MKDGLAWEAHLAEQAKLKEQRIEQLTNSQKLLSAKIELWKQKLRAHGEKGARERDLIVTFSKACGVQIMTHGGYLEAHKSFEDAENGLMQVQIAELQSQYVINQAALDVLQPPEPKIQSPGGIIRPS